MSREEKLIAMQALMMESKDIWTLKDLEKECPKKKGIVAMSVKDVLQEACDEGLVSFDKIGSGNFYWCFPSEAYNRRKVRESQITASIEALSLEHEQLGAQIQELMAGRDESPERDALEEEIQKLEAQQEEINKTLTKYDSMNPDVIRKMQRQTELALEAANRWSDNICTLRSWTVKQFGFTKDRFNKQFEVDESFDYPE